MKGWRTNRQMIILTQCNSLLPPNVHSSAAQTHSEMSIRQTRFVGYMTTKHMRQHCRNGFLSALRSAFSKFWIKGWLRRWEGRLCRSIQHSVGLCNMPIPRSGSRTEPNIVALSPWPWIWWCSTPNTICPACPIWSYCSSCGGLSAPNKTRKRWTTEAVSVNYLSSACSKLPVLYQ